MDRNVLGTPVLLPERFFFAAFLALLSLTVFLVRGGYDSELLLAIYRGSDAKSAGFWKLISVLGSNQTLIPVVVAFGLLLVWRKQKEIALWLVLGWAMTTSTVDLIKWLVARGRPPVPFLTGATGSAFPSGHAAESLFVFYYLWIILARAPQRRRGFFGAGMREFCSILLVVLPAIVGYSRVYLGVHWPSDVVGGWAIGLFILAIALLNTSQGEEAPADADK